MPNAWGAEKPVCEYFIPVNPEQRRRNEQIIADAAARIAEPEE